MTQPAWDLDAPVDDPPRTGPGRPGLALALAFGLGGLGLGALIGSALAAPAAPRSPATATLSVRDLSVEAPATPGTGATPPAGPRSRAGNAVVVFRLQVDNSEAGPIRVTGLELDGVTRTGTPVLPLDLRVAGRSSATTDITTRPDCSADREPQPVRAWLRVTEPGDSDARRVRIPPTAVLAQSGGLCSLVDADLPNGWRGPLQATSTRLEGKDLEVVLADLSGVRLSGIVLDGELVPTVIVGDQLITARARVRAGEPTRLRLRGPPPCIRFGSGAPIPTTARLLAEGDQDLQQRLMVVGPDLARWLEPACSD